jgi:hypothetical protein
MVRHYRAMESEAHAKLATHLKAFQAALAGGRTRPARGKSAALSGD